MAALVRWPVAQLALTKTGGDASRIFVLSIPDSGAAPADVATGIDAYNSVNKDLAAANGIGCGRRRGKRAFEGALECILSQ